MARVTRKTATVADRHIAYKSMLYRSYRLTVFHGLCSLADDFGIEAYGNDMADTLPELWAKKPEDCGTYWFETNKEGWMERRKLLKQCIKETAA